MTRQRASLLTRLQAYGARARLWDNDADLIRPQDAPQAFAAGSNSSRILLIGSGPVVGWGVASHDLALPGALARTLASDSSRGAIVDVVPQPSVGIRHLRRLSQSITLDRYDAVLLTSTVTDALRLVGVRRWSSQLHRLLQDTQDRTTGAVFWLGAQPIPSIPGYDTPLGHLADEQARLLNAAAITECQTVGAFFIPMQPPPASDASRHRSPADYDFWGHQIALALTPHLLTGRRANSMHSTADDRQMAIDHLDLRRHRGDPRLQEIVSAAKQTLGADAAMITILDDRKEWLLASTTPHDIQIDLEHSVCIHTIQSPDGLVVRDATTDKRFSTNPLVTGPSALRSYAGYPIEAPDGTRIGALCVFSRTVQNKFDTSKTIDTLRELALLAQRELWRWTPPRKAPTSTRDVASTRLPNQFPTTTPPD